MINRGIVWIFFFYVLYSKLLHLPPLRFLCAGGCWDRNVTTRHWQSDALTARLDFILFSSFSYTQLNWQTAIGDKLNTHTFSCWSVELALVVFLSMRYIYDHKINNTLKGRQGFEKSDAVILFSAAPIHCSALTVIMYSARKILHKENEICWKSTLSILKGVWHEIFDFRFFSWLSVPWAHEYSLGAVSNFFENSRRYSRMNVITGVNDTGDKLFTGVNDTGNKFIAGIVDTGD